MEAGGEGDQDNEREELHEQEDNRQQVFLPLHQLPCMEVEREYGQTVANFLSILSTPPSPPASMHGGGEGER